MQSSLQLDHFCDSCRDRGQRTFGTVFRCPQGCDYDMCVECSKEPQCQKGHAMSRAVHQGYFCDMCKANGTRTIGTAYCCPKGCNYDLCSSCFDRCRAERAAATEMPDTVAQEFFANVAAATAAAPLAGQARTVRRTKRWGCCLNVGMMLCAVGAVGAAAYKFWYRQTHHGGNGPATYAHYVTDELTSDDIQVDHVWVRIPRADETSGNAVFASMQYYFEANVGGYFGTQAWREGATDLLGATIGADETHQVIFSVWDADEDHKVSWDGSGCGRFGGEGTGSHCRLHYPLREGVRYTLRVSKTGNSSQGVGWTGTITDPETGAVSTVGTLILPHYKGYQGFGQFATRGDAFLEYFLATGCDGQPVGSVGLFGPYFNERTSVALQAMPDYAGPCLYNDVSDCIPGHGCGRPRVLMTAGGTTNRTTEKGETLWPEEAQEQRWGQALVA